MSERVQVTRAIMPPREWGIYALIYMQVCAAADATDEEILATCEAENPCGTSNGWGTVHRENKPESDTDLWRVGPVKCADNPERIHFLVSC